MLDICIVSDICIVRIFISEMERHIISGKSVSIFPLSNKQI